MYTIEQSRKFKKDFKKYLHDKEKLIALNEVLKHLEETGEVPKEFYPHSLKGEYSGAMECHIQRDSKHVTPLGGGSFLCRAARKGCHSRRYR